jgi:hypothetical protein
MNAAPIRTSVALLVFILSTGCIGGIGIGCGVEPAARDSAPNGTSSAGSRAPTITVAANRGWQDTGIRVEPQQKFQLRYRSGAIVDKETKIADAHGSDYICGDPGCCEPLPEERRGALVARIGGDVFIVGNGGEYSSPAGGIIFLRVNDCDDGLVDNSGELRVEFIP